MTLHPEEQKKARRKAMQLLEHMDRTERACLTVWVRQAFPKKLLRMPLLM